MKTGKSLYSDARSAGHIGSVSAVAFAPNSRSLATIGSDGTLRVWDRATGEHKVHKVRLGSACPLLYTADGKLITLGAEVGTLSHWDADTGKEIRQFALSQKLNFSSDVMAARLTEDGKILLVRGHTQLPISSGSMLNEQREPLLAWDFATGKVVLETSIRCQPWASSAFSPSGRFMDREGKAEWLDVWTGRSRPLAPKSSAPFRMCTFSPDGRWLATLEPGDVNNWQDLAPACKKLTAPKGALDPAACWKDLANSDPKVAWTAIEKLALDPTAAWKLLGERLKPLILDGEKVAERIAELSSKDFKTRESATVELKRVVEAARPLLVEARRTATSAEAQQRLDEVLDYAPAIPTDGAIRDLRAAVLERIGTQEAKDALKTLAGGAPGAELTREAKAALERFQLR